MAVTVILLNGVGGAGKSTIARALQALLCEPWLNVAMDSFLDMLPEHLHDDPDGFVYRTEYDASGKPQVVIETGETGHRLLSGMRLAVAAMARAGNNLIVDDVVLDGGLEEYDALLAEFRFLKVGVFAPLAVLEEREAARADRMPGLARWQFPRVHQGAHYDFEIDTTLADAAVCAERIAAHFGLKRKTDSHD